MDYFWKLSKEMVDCLVMQMDEESVVVFMVSWEVEVIYEYGKIYVCKYFDFRDD